MPGRSASSRPVYVDLLPPCNAGCPAGENIQAWLAHAEVGHHEQAWRQLVADNPMPAIHGRVCYHPCESVCNRASLDSAVSIHSVERFLGDLALERAGHSTARRSAAEAGAGHRAGPSGLSAAYHLARLGHEVEIRDAGDRPGGMMRYGIPAYRMPRDVLDAEIDRIAGAGRAHDLRPPGGGPGRRAARGRLRRRVRRGGRAPVQAGRHPGQGRGADRGRGVVPAQRGLGRAAGDRAAGRRLRRRQHRDGRRPGRPPPGRERRAHRLPPHPGPDARSRRRGRGGRARGRADQLAAHDHRVRRPGTDRRGHGTG